MLHYLLQNTCIAIEKWYVWQKPKKNGMYGISYVNVQKLMLLLVKASDSIQRDTIPSVGLVAGVLMYLV